MNNPVKIALVSPYTKQPLEETPDGLRNSNESFPVRNGVYRLVDEKNYTDNFGFQWNKFEKTQIDRFAERSSQSRERFFAVTKWHQQELRGQNVLEVGSGAGRFTEVILNHTNATLYSVDFSQAVEANFRNNGPHNHLYLFQASIYELPFKPNQFDKVFCFGVLQHTPDFKKSLTSLAAMVKPGGELVVDFYPVKGWYTKAHAKYIFRPFTKRMKNEQLLRWIESNVSWLMRANNFFERIGVGRFVNRFLPICDIKNTIPSALSYKVKREWVILDTFDMFSPEYDNPQKLDTVVAWLKELGMKEVIGDTVFYGEGNSVTYVRAIG